MSSLEKTLLEAGNVLSNALIRAKVKAHDEVIAQEMYAELIEYAGHLSISRGLAVGTSEKYIDAVTLYLEYLNNKRIELEDALPADVERWMQSLFIHHHQKSKTIGNKLVAVRQWYAWREQQGKGANPALNVRGPKKDKHIPRKYSRGQLRKILSSCDLTTPIGIRDYAILLLFLSTGARRSEIANLSLQQITLGERTGAVRFMGKGRKERMVTFQGPVIKALIAWLVARDEFDTPDRDAIFIGVGIGGHTPNMRLTNSGLDRVIDRAKAAAKVIVEAGMALHALRSTFATALYDDGNDLEEIRILMGHESIETTRRYIAISERVHRTRLSTDFLKDVTGEKVKKLPKWAEQELQRRGINHEQ